MKRGIPFLSWLIVILSALYFLVPLYASFQFSMQMRRGVWSFDAYASVFSSSTFLNTLSFSALAALAAVIVGAALVVPTAYWVRLRLPKLRGVLEFISLLPLIIPPVVIVFGHIRLFGASSFLPLTTTDVGTTILLIMGYVVLSLPYMYRAIDNGMATIDINTLTEAAESLGASRTRTIIEVIFPNVRSAIVSGAFLTFSICLGEYVLASLLARPAFGPYMLQLGQDRAYEPAALAIVSFGITWLLMALMQIFATRKPGQGFLPRFGARKQTQ